MTRDINPEAFTTPIDPAEFNTGGDTTFDIPGYSDPAVLKNNKKNFQNMIFGMEKQFNL